MDTAENISFAIGGESVSALPGQSILDAALNAGIYIPHLCSHPGLEARGGCKLCSVEIKGHSGIVSSCMTPAEDGMEVIIKSEELTHLRQVALELLLACHPADCTSCTVYLKCELQNLMQYLGVAHSRLRRIDKKNVRTASGPANPLMKREMERCIQCGRCVRACGGLRGVGALEHRSKNGECYVGVKDDVALAESDCRFCGACVEVCPTGAIQDMEGVFPADVPKARALTPCKEGCPAHTDIFEYIRLSKAGRYSDAVSVIREKLTFPAVLGLVCTHKCEYECKRAHLDDALSIKEIKRFAVEHDNEELWKTRVEKEPDTGRKVCVVGAGPAGLTAAWHLSRKGHDVVVLEKDPLPGGMMRYGIPLYRLGRDILDREIDTLCGMGFEIRTGTKAESAEVLKDEFDAVVVAVGAQKGVLPDAGLAGFENVYSAVDFCRLAASGELGSVSGTVTVVGGGNVAFDCARIAAKSGAECVRVVCLEGRDKMLADDEEIEAATEEGIEIICDAVIEETVSRAGSRIDAAGYTLVKSFSFGAGGLEYEAVPDSRQYIDTDAIIYAMGQRIDLDEGFGLALGRGNSVSVDGWKASLDGVFAAGDAVTGTKSIVESIASGASCAAAVDIWLGGNGDVDMILFDREETPDEIGVIEGFAAKTRHDHICDAEAAADEAGRCLLCDLRLKIPKVRYWGDQHYSTAVPRAGGTG